MLSAKARQGPCAAVQWPSLLHWKAGHSWQWLFTLFGHILPALVVIVTVLQLPGTSVFPKCFSLRFILSAAVGSSPVDGFLPIKW